MSASFAQANPASPSGASTLPTCAIDTDSFDDPTESVAEPVPLPTVKIALVPAIR